MKRETISIYFGILLLGAIIGDYLALFERTRLFFGGFKYPILLVISTGLILLGRRKNNHGVPKDPIYPLLFLSAFICGSALHHNTLHYFPNNRFWLIVWSGMIPTMLLLIQTITKIPISKGLIPLEFSIIIGLTTYLFLRIYSESWDTSSVAITTLCFIIIFFLINRVFWQRYLVEENQNYFLIDFQNCIPIGFLYGIFLIGSAGKQIMIDANMNDSDMMWLGGLFPSTVMITKYLLWISFTWILVSLIPNPPIQISEDE